jgi:cytoskeletal protein CcmA (bactofilin family)
MGKAVKVIGQIFTKEDLQIDGDVEGAIESQDNKITIGPSGRVQASILARDIVILGQVQGNIQASGKVELRSESKLIGDITTSRISIEDGASFNGRIETRKPEMKPVPVALQKPSGAS